MLPSFSFMCLGLLDEATVGPVQNPVAQACVTGTRARIRLAGLQGRLVVILQRGAEVRSGGIWA